MLVSTHIFCPFAIETADTLLDMTIRLIPKDWQQWRKSAWNSVRTKGRILKAWLGRVGLGTLATEGKVWDRPSPYSEKNIFFSLEMVCFDVR